MIKRLSDEIELEIVDFVDGSSTFILHYHEEGAISYKRVALDENEVVNLIIEAEQYIRRKNYLKECVK